MSKVIIDKKCHPGTHQVQTLDEMCQYVIKKSRVGITAN